MNKPILGISMGDPFGNGPEITVRALADPKIYDRCRPLVVGDASSMAYALKVAKKVSGVELGMNICKDVKDARFDYGTVDVLDMGLVPAQSIPDTSDLEVPKPFGVGACALGGEAAFQYEAVAKIQPVFKFGNPNTIIKKAVSLMGYPVGDCRRPFSYLCDEGLEALKQVLEETKNLG